MVVHSGAPLTLFGLDGRRKYLTAAERARFIAAASQWPRAEVGTLCLVLAYTGCRISEALALSIFSVEPEEGFIAIQSLKKRGLISYRQVPIPGELVERLHRVHPATGGCADARLWPLSRSRAWQLVKALMAEASIGAGPHMTPKGLRHGFGIHAIRSGVPLNLLQRWLGHASLETTSIYASALGNEEREIASRMWTAPEAQGLSAIR
jgi:integrase